MKLTIPAVCIVLVCVWAGLDAVCIQRSLSSNSYAYLRTVVNGARKITSVRVLKRYSQAACTLNHSFGYLGGDAWVHRGCRAKFRICYVAGVSKTLTCSSNGFKYSECYAGVPKVWEVYPVTHLSKSPCIQDFSYGMKGNRVWVDKGCRATFHVTG